MSDASLPGTKGLMAWLTPGLFWLTLAFLGAGVFFYEGLDALLVATGDVFLQHAEEAANGEERALQRCRGLP